MRTARELTHEGDLPEERPEDSETGNRASPEDVPIPSGANATIQDAIDRLYQKLKGFPR